MCIPFAGIYPLLIEVSSDGGSKVQVFIRRCPKLCNTMRRLASGGVRQCLSGIFHLRLMAWSCLQATVNTWRLRQPYLCSGLGERMKSTCLAMFHNPTYVHSALSCSWSCEAFAPSGAPFSHLPCMPPRLRIVLGKGLIPPYHLPGEKRWTRLGAHGKILQGWQK